MNISRELYQTMQDQTAPKSKAWKNIPLAFLIGGLICAIGEAGIHILTEFCGVEQKTAAPHGSPSGWLPSAPSAPVWAGTPNWASTPAQARWCPSPALPTAWYPPPSRHAPRAGFWGSARRFSPLPVPSFSMAQPPPWCTASCTTSGRSSDRAD